MFKRLQNVAPLFSVPRDFIFNNVVSHRNNGIRRSYIRRVCRRWCSRRWGRNDGLRRGLVLRKTRAYTQFKAQSN